LGLKNKLIQARFPFLKNAFFALFLHFIVSKPHFLTQIDGILPSIPAVQS